MIAYYAILRHCAVGNHCPKEYKGLLGLLIFKRYKCERESGSVTTQLKALLKKIDFFQSCVCDVCGLKLATQHGLRVHKLVHQVNWQAAHQLWILPQGLELLFIT